MDTRCDGPNHPQTAQLCTSLPALPWKPISFGTLSLSLCVLLGVLGVASHNKRSFVCLIFIRVVHANHAKVHLLHVLCTLCARLAPVRRCVNAQVARRGGAKATHHMSVAPVVFNVCVCLCVYMHANYCDGGVRLWVRYCMFVCAKFKVKDIIRCCISVWSAFDGPFFCNTSPLPTIFVCLFQLICTRVFRRMRICLWATHTLLSSTNAIMCRFAGSGLLL